MNTETQLTEFAFEIVPADLGLELAAKNSLELAFSGFFTDAAKWKAHAETITDAKLARTARLELKNLRVSAEKVRKNLKEDSLRMGKAIDGANNILLALIVPIEKSLEDIEKAEERAEAARIQALREERAEILETMDHVTHGINLGMMTSEQWASYHQQAKDAFFARREREKKAKEEAEALAKKEADEREAQRLENIRLREEADKAAADLAAEREAQAKRDEAAKAERDAAEAKARAEVAAANEAAEMARQKANADLLAEQTKAKAEREKLEAEAKVIRDAELKRLSDEKAAAEAKAKADAAAAKKAAAAPDKAKIAAYAERIKSEQLPQLSAAGLSELMESARESFLARVREIYAAL